MRGASWPPTPKRSRRLACLDQAKQRDLRRRAKALGRAPVARSAAHVHPHVVQPMQACRERLLQRNEEIPRKELATMRVAGQLELVARLHRRDGATGLMGQ